ncbi:hypothetical protein CW304_21645 [Bacillus sp. UFRGS-B20]|nr:hypothetical protein CW304_21645 [Bacillus sp. UFRGS-B20]
MNPIIFHFVNCFHVCTNSFSQVKSVFSFFFLLILYLPPEIFIFEGKGSVRFFYKDCSFRLLKEGTHSPS